MHQKRGRPKNRRAGCLLCKVNKMNGWPDDNLGIHGFGKIRASARARESMKEEMRAG